MAAILNLLKRFCCVLNILTIERVDVRSFVLIGLLLCGFSPCYGLDLLQAYQAARLHDGQYQADQSRFKAQLLNEKIGRARSLPQLSYHYRWMKNDYRSDQQGVRFPDSFEEQLLGCGQTNDQLGCLVDGLTHVEVYKLRSKYTSQESNLTLTQVIFDPEVGAERAQGRALALQAAAEMSAAEKQLILRVLTAYLRLLQAEQERQEQAQLLAGLAEHYDLLEQQRQLGVADEENWLEMQLSMEAQQLAYEASEAQLLLSRKQLEQLLGQEVSELAQLSDKLVFSAFEIKSIDHYSRLALEFNDGIKLAEAAEQMADNELRKHKVNRLPRVTVAANYQDRELKGGHAFQPASTSTAYGVDVRLPLYHGGALYYGRKKAAYQQLEAQDKVQWQKQQVEQALNSQLLILQGFERRLASAERGLAIHQQSLELHEKAYQSGSKPYLALLKVQQAHSKAKAQRADLQRQFLMHWFEFKFLVGTLSVDDIKQANTWFVQH